MWSTKIRKKEHEDSQSPFLRYYDILNRKRQRDRLCVLFLSFLSINFLYGWRSLSSMSLDAIYDSKVTLHNVIHVTYKSTRLSLTWDGSLDKPAVLRVNELEMRKLRKSLSATRWRCISSYISGKKSSDDNYLIILL